MASPFDNDAIDKAATESGVIDAPPTTPLATPVVNHHTLLSNLLTAGILGSRAADIYTTNKVLGVGGHENSPLYSQNRVGNALGQAGVGIAQALLSRYLASHGHPNLAIAAAVPSIGIEVKDAAHNANQMAQYNQAIKGVK